MSTEYVEPELLILNYAGLRVRIRKQSGIKLLNKYKEESFHTKANYDDRQRRFELRFKETERESVKVYDCNVVMV